MKLDDNNIEELFKSQFENFEAPVNDAMWSNISQGIQSGAGSAGATAGKTLLSKWVATAGIAVTTGVVGAALTFAIMSEDTTVSEPTTPATETVKEEVITTPEQDLTEVPTDEVVAANNVITSLPTDENDPVIEKVVEEVEDKKFVVDDKSDDPENAIKDYEAILMFSSPQQLDASNDAAANENDVTEEKTIEEQLSEIQSDIPVIITQVDKGEVIASIVASPVGGYAPLDVFFSRVESEGKVHWNFGDGTTSNEENPSHTFTKYGKYTVELTVTDADGNTQKDFKVIVVEGNSSITNIPNIFTPNSDGYNDVFTVEGNNIESFQLNILNKLGETVYTTESMEDGWDGRDVYGKAAPDDTYLYIIYAKGVDGKLYEHKGTITLNR